MNPELQKESHYMPQACRVWLARAKDLGLKGKARDRDMEAFMQGVLATATATGAMNLDRAQQIAFLCAVGRLETFVKAAAAETFVKGAAAK